MRKDIPQPEPEQDRPALLAGYAASYSQPCLARRASTRCEAHTYGTPVPPSDPRGPGGWAGGRPRVALRRPACCNLEKYGST